MPKATLMLLVGLFLCATHSRVLGDSAPPWSPMWEVAHFPMAIRVPKLGDKRKEYGLTEKMVRDAVELRLRANGIPIGADALDSPMPHIFAFVRPFGVSGPSGDGVFYSAELSVRDPMILDCDGGGYVLASIWSFGSMGFARVEEYPQEALGWISKLADAFSLEYLRASDDVPHSIDIFAERLAKQYACQAH